LPWHREGFSRRNPLTSEYLAYARPVSKETAGFCKLSQQENDGEPFGKHKLAEFLPMVEYEWPCQLDTGINVPCLSGLEGLRDVGSGPDFYNFSFEP
jgi:hypothetical protein